MRLLLVLLVAMLAGCADAPEAEDEPFETLEAEATETTGAISGIVVTETIVPVAGATVTIVGVEEPFTTNEDGQFAIEDLEPGVYFIEAMAEGHLAAQQSVEVIAGEVALPRIMLPFDTSPQPYQLTQQFKGHMALSDYILIYTISDVLGANDLCQCEFFFDADAGVDTIVLETYWESSFTRVEEHDMYWDFWGGSEGHTSKWILSGDSWHMSGDGFASDETSWRALISSGEQPDIEQGFEGFVTFWYLEAPPADWAYAV